jgi:tRNA threonylcarbamoyladenosine biosynthesis protein TsaB
MQVLAMDTSTSCLSVALVRDGETVCEINQQTKAGHAGMVLPVIDEVLARASTDKSRLDLIAVGTGPGSFTGIRIGIATAQGLSDALSCPLLGVSSLDTLAHGVLPSPIPVLPVIDARKGEVFCARYDEHGSRFSEAEHLKPEQVVDMVKDETLFTAADAPCTGRCSSGGWEDSTTRPPPTCGTRGPRCSQGSPCPSPPRRTRKTCSRSTCGSRTP